MLHTVPLDRSVYGPFKRHLSAAQNDWLRSNSGKSITIYDIPSLVKQAFLRASTPINITSARSLVIDRPMSQQCEEDVAKATEAVSEVSRTLDEHRLPSTSTAMEPLPSSSTTIEPLSTTVEPFPFTSTAIETLLSISTAVETQPSLITDEAETANVSESLLCP